MSDPKTHLTNLLTHARKVIDETYKLSIELSKDTISEAEKKIKYANLVLKSLNDGPFKECSKMDSDPELVELFYESVISVSPTLSRAIEDLEDSIKSYYQKEKEEKEDAANQQILKPEKDSPEEEIEEFYDDDEFITGIESNNEEDNDISGDELSH